MPSAREEEMKEVRIRTSTFVRFSADEIVAIAASEQVEESVAPGSDRAVSTGLDFGTFRTGVPQYSHAHWNAANASLARPQVDEQIAVDPASLRPNANSLRAEVCSNASSTSLGSVKSKSTASTPTTTTTPGTDLSLSFVHNSGLLTTEVDNTHSANMDSPTLRDMPIIAAEDSVPDVQTLEAQYDLPLPGATTLTDQSDSAAPVPDETTTKDSPPPVNPTTQVKDFADNLSDSSNTTAIRTDAYESNVSDEQDYATIQRSFPMLKNRLPPIVTDHPAYGSDPFTSSSDSPRISSSWTPSHVRTYNENQKPLNDEPKAKNNLLNLARASIRDQELISLADAAKEGPPKSSPITADRRASVAILPSTSRPRTASSTASTTPSTRKFSPFSLSSLASAFQSRADPPQFDRVAYLQKQEHTIRAKTSSLPRANASMYPTHPDTGRNWMHRNLRCTSCATKGCANCGKACCAWKAAALGTENHRDNEEGLERAQEIKEEIEAFDSRGKEVPTFLKCSDCEKIVCPECCGECCDDICKSVCCRKCKEEPWDVCDYHRDL